MKKHVCLKQSCPWVGSTRGLGWVEYDKSTIETTQYCQKLLVVCTAYRPAQLTLSVISPLLDTTLSLKKRANFGKL